MLTRWSTLRWLFAALGLGYLGICANLYLRQDGLIFPAQSLNQPRAAKLEHDHPGSHYTLQTSDGQPSQTPLVADAQTVFDALATDPRIDPKRIVVIGRSLGSGVAVQLAAKRPLQALILVTPYYSMLNVAAEKYPWLPVRWMLRHPFDSQALAPSLQLPTQILLAEQDQLIPPAHGARLAAAWGSPVQPLLLPGASHHDILMHPHFWLEVRGFLQRQES